MEMSWEQMMRIKCNICSRIVEDIKDQEKKNQEKIGVWKHKTVLNNISSHCWLVASSGFLTDWYFINRMELGACFTCPSEITSTVQWNVPIRFCYHPHTTSQFSEATSICHNSQNYAECPTTRKCSGKSSHGNLDKRAWYRAVYYFTLWWSHKGTNWTRDNRSLLDGSDVRKATSLQGNICLSCCRYLLNFLLSIKYCMEQIKIQSKGI